MNGDSSPTTIFIVEDEAAIRRLATTILERAGYRVVTAEDATHAQEVAAGLDRAPDLVITDLLLPGGNGKGVAERLRARWPGPLPIIVVSGHPERSEDLPPGASFLGKPFGPDELLAAVRGRLANGGVP